MSKVELQLAIDTTFYKILNVIGDICERACCDKEVFLIISCDLICDHVCVIDITIFK